MQTNLKKQIIKKKLREKHNGFNALYKDFSSINNFIDNIALKLSKGAQIVQLQGDNLTDKEFLDCAIKIKQLCEIYNATFIVKSRADIAYLSGADSVNLKQEDLDIRRVKEMFGEEIIIGIYVDTKDGALSAVKDGADYISVNQIFPTPTEPVKNTGLEYAKWVSENTFLPVLLERGTYTESQITVIQ